MTPGQQERARRELARARQALAVAGLILEEGALEDAASRLYYAVFHAATAALAVGGRHAKTHSGLVTSFNQVFGPAPVLGRLLELRAAADYDPEPFETSAGALQAELAQAAAFVERCQAIVDEATAGGPDEADPPPDY